MSNIPSSSSVMSIKNLACISTIVSLLTVAVSPALAIFGFGDSETSRRDYQRCASDLAGLQITSEEAATACSRAFRPDDLGVCVRRTSEGGTITAADALSACRQVRRPVDMATCVTEIRRDVNGVAAGDALNSCRRSLLPQRYSNCVRGITVATKLAPAQALTSCIDASDFPRDLDPTFIPYTTTPGVFTPAPTVTPSPTDPTTAPAPASPTP